MPVAIQAVRASAYGENACVGRLPSSPIALCPQSGSLTKCLAGIPNAHGHAKAVGFFISLIPATFLGKTCRENTKSSENPSIFPLHH
jgi:hypothetical protein